MHIGWVSLQDTECPEHKIKADSGSDQKNFIIKLQLPSNFFAFCFLQTQSEKKLYVGENEKKAVRFMLHKVL
jgi:hypothetical protein